MKSIQPGIPPDVLARLRALRLSSRGVTLAPGVGQHPSRSRGAGLEFAQYRAYEQGDELRRIDWKLFARSDRYFVREADRDSPLRVWLLLDTSASMGQADGARPEWSRLDAARIMALCVIQIALRQGDFFGTVLMGEESVVLTPLGSGGRHRDRCALAAANAQAAGKWPAEHVLRPLWEHIRAGDLVLMIGDHFDEGCVAFLERLALAGRDVVSIVTLTQEERDFPFAGGQRFRDPESSAEIITDAPASRDAFIAAFASAREGLRARLAAAGVRSAEYFLDQPVDEPLHILLGSRHAPV